MMYQKMECLGFLERSFEFITKVANSNQNIVLPVPQLLGKKQTFQSNEKFRDIRIVQSQKNVFKNIVKMAWNGWTVFSVLLTVHCKIIFT